MPMPRTTQVATEASAPQQPLAEFFPLLPEEEALSDKLREAALRSQNSILLGDKDYLRTIHVEAKRLASGPRADKLLRLLKKRESWFKSGSQIVPENIRPRLHLVGDSLTEDLWLIGRSFWSMPFNKGYGRRLRFVILDEAHDSLIGLIGLQSPPADLSCRDSRFEYPVGGKLQLVNQTMDAYTVGAIPPYSNLLGGKLCAGLICSDSIRQAYWRTYAKSRTQMEGRRIDQPLVAVTTTSAFGRSSQYNRLSYKGRLLAEQIGETKGYGLLHLEHLYSEIETFLKRRGISTRGGFGNGPKVRWQNVTRVLHLLGLPNTLLAHGLKRPVYLFSFVEELAAGMAGGSFGRTLPLKEDDFADYWLERWAVPRAYRCPEWSAIDGQSLLRQRIVGECAYAPLG